MLSELDDLPCQQLVELVTAYLDDELDTETRARFEQHIARCEGCATYLEQFRQTISMLGTLAVEDLSDESLSAMRRAFRSWAR
jgi:anti-sigma factor RsiW